MSRVWAASIETFNPADAVLSMPAGWDSECTVLHDAHQLGMYQRVPTSTKPGTIGPFSTLLPESASNPYRALRVADLNVKAFTDSVPAALARWGCPRLTRRRIVWDHERFDGMGDFGTPQHAAFVVSMLDAIRAACPYAELGMWDFPRSINPGGQHGLVNANPAFAEVWPRLTLACPAPYLHGVLGRASQPTANPRVVTMAEQLNYLRASVAESRKVMPHGKVLLFLSASYSWFYAKGASYPHMTPSEFGWLLRASESIGVDVALWEHCPAGNVAAFTAFRDQVIAGA